MPPISTSKSSVNIKTILGFLYIVTTAGRLFKNKVTQIRLKFNNIRRSNRIEAISYGIKTDARV